MSLHYFTLGSDPAATGEDYFLEGLGGFIKPGLELLGNIFAHPLFKQLLAFKFDLLRGLLAGGDEGAGAEGGPAAAAEQRRV